MDPPDASPTRSTPPRPPSPALPGGTPKQTKKGTKLQLDMTLGSAVSALVHHLATPLAPHYSHAQLMGLRSYLSAALTKTFGPTWDENVPHAGSGFRSLIADQIHGLPPILKSAASAKGIDTAVWTSAIATLRKKKVDDGESDMWEVWCDPGMVVWRWGGWGWDEVEFDPVRGRRGE